MDKNYSKAIKELNGKKIALLGFGLDNQALLAWLDKHHVKAEISICDSRTQNNLPQIKTRFKLGYRLGPAFNQGLGDFDHLFRSPGWPIACPGIQRALAGGKTKLDSPLNLFFQICPSKKIIGITGSKGKGTTSSLIYKMILDDGRRAWLGGNIGISPFSFIDKIKTTDYVILELSSFQLEDLRYSPSIAVITNLFKEHLAPADPLNPNFHKSLRAYWQAKLNIAKNSGNNFLVANHHLGKRLEKDLPQKNTSLFYPSHLPSLLEGIYNQENIAAAVEVAKRLKIKKSNYEKTVAAFSNLEHRLELAIEKNGIRYFDNSFSTTPESSTMDLKSFSSPIILIAGGAEKGADFRSFGQAISRRVKKLILLPGKATPRLKQAVLEAGFDKKKINMAGDMLKAVESAKKSARSGDVVLLSTGCASFGIFKNYKERGNLFKEYSRQLNS